jgi:hypothetical protein
MALQVSYVGPPIDDQETLERLPADLKALLNQANGFIQFRGGLHVRGACRAPAWHSLREAWEGEDAFHSLYPDVNAGDVPFAEDCLGDQFLLRDEQVWKLSAETGEMGSLELSLREFFAAAQNDPVEFLSLHPLLQFENEGGKLEPGQLLSAMPPFCLAESGEGVSLRAISGDDRRRFLADLARQIRDVPDGGKIVFKFKKDDDE